jgi:hypothetical protein
MSRYGPSGGGYLKAEIGDVQAMIARLHNEYRITDKALLIKGVVVLGFTVALFIAHGFLHMEPSIAALLGATGSRGGWRGWRGRCSDCPILKTYCR